MDQKPVGSTTPAVPKRIRATGRIFVHWGYRGAVVLIACRSWKWTLLQLWTLLRSPLSGWIGKMWDQIGGGIKQNVETLNVQFKLSSKQNPYLPDKYPKLPMLLGIVLLMYRLTLFKNALLCSCLATMVVNYQRERIDTVQYSSQSDEDHSHNYLMENLQGGPSKVSSVDTLKHDSETLPAYSSCSIDKKCSSSVREIHGHLFSTIGCALRHWMELGCISLTGRMSHSLGVLHLAFSPDSLSVQSFSSGLTFAGRLNSLSSVHTRDLDVKVELLSNIFSKHR